MLKLETSTGSLELSADQERAVRSMTDAEVCRALNRGSDPFVLAALKERPQIQLHPAAGWIYSSSPHLNETLPYRHCA
jgi:hypothetical protein